MRREDLLGFWLDAAGRSPLLTHREEVELGRAVRRWQDWEGGADAAPAAVQRRGQRARDRMVRANLRLVVKCAKALTGPRLIEQGYLLDLLQEGAIGLMRAAEKFDPATGYKFSTYAFWWIQQGVMRSLGMANLIRVPSGVLAMVAKVRREGLEHLKPSERKTVGMAVRSEWVLSLDKQLQAGDGAEASQLHELVSADGPDQMEQLAIEGLVEQARTVCGTDWEWMVALEGGATQQEVAMQHGVSRQALQKNRSKLQARVREALTAAA